MAVTYTITRPQGLIIINAVGVTKSGVAPYPSTASIPFRRLNQIITGSSGDYVIIDFEGLTDFNIYPATDILILLGTTYAAGSNTADQMTLLLSNSEVFYPL